MADRDGRRRKIIDLSRRKYGTPRAEVEAMLADQSEARVESAGATMPRAPAEISKVVEHPPPPKAPKPSERERSSEPNISGLPPGTDEDSRHAEIKRQIGDRAESLDYTVSFEESVLDGQGRIDIVLHRGQRSIACEVSVRNTVEYGVANVAKCLEAGYSDVAVICSVRSKLARIEHALGEKVAPEQLTLITFFLPDEFVQRLSKWAAEDPRGGIAEREKLRKRHFNLDDGQSDAQRKLHEKEMLKNLAETMRRNKG